MIYSGSAVIQENKIKCDTKTFQFVDQLNLIKRLRENNGFYYMIYAVKRSSEYFSPYAFK